MDIALVVEDDPNVARLCVRLLGRSHFESQIVGTAAEAVARLKSDVPLGLAYVDLGLPDGSGLDVANLARQLHPRLPIVLATGSLGDATGAEHVRLQKPFTLDQFQAAVDEAILRQYGQEPPQGA
jgi:DNA-binding response OmpR family regulator